MSHTPAAAGRGQASDQASKVSQAGAGDPGRHVKTKAHPRAARSFEGQPKITSTDPGTSPGSGPTKASQIICHWFVIESSRHLAGVDGIEGGSSARRGWLCPVGVNMILIVMRAKTL
jgi:hypothetical protein